MIGPTGAVRVMVATKPVDFRKGAEGLAALVRETMQADPFDGAIYVFPGEAGGSDQAGFLGRHGRVPVRQTTGGRRVPLAQDEDGVIRLSAAQFSALLEGLDWRRVHARGRRRRPTLPG